MITVFACWLWRGGDSGGDSDGGGSRRGRGKMIMAFANGH